MKNPTRYSSNYLFFLNIFKNKRILAALIQKELKNRYASSYLGFLWTLFQPISMIIIYTIVFSVVLKVRVPAIYKETPYVVFLLCGLIPFQIFSETTERSSRILIENMNMITKMVFPYELFPVSLLLTSFITGGITLILTIFILVIMGIPPSLLHLLYIIIFFIPLILFTIGISWIVSCISVPIRDITFVVPVINNLLFFATPIIYSHDMLDKIPPNLGFIAFMAKLNPLYSITMGFRSALIGNYFSMPYKLIVILYIISIVTFIVGGALFNGFKKELADIY